MTKPLEIAFQPLFHSMVTTFAATLASLSPHSASLPGLCSV